MGVGGVSVLKRLGKKVSSLILAPTRFLCLQSSKIPLRIQAYLTLVLVGHILLDVVTVECI